jgi:hypothetical protein
MGMDGKPIFVKAPYPKDFAVLLKQLEKNHRSGKVKTR